MRSIPIICLIFFFFNIASTAQQKYTIENIKELSQIELNNYMDDAIKLKKKGSNGMIVGGIIVGASITYVAVAGDFGAAAIGGATGILGLSILTVGAFKKSSGKRIIRYINKFNSEAGNAFSFDIKPHAQFDYLTHNYHPGLSLRISF